jgi:hypothetical protein
MKKMIAKKIPSKRYGAIIEINTPMRFYWDNEGVFDGVEFVIPKGTSAYQRRLIMDTVGITQLMMVLFEEMNEHMDKERQTPVPDYVKKAFDEDDREPA